MHYESLKSISCPKCKKKLSFSDTPSSTGEIEEGTLVCEKRHTWTVHEGIPSLVHPPVTSEDAKWIAEYDEMAENYDELVKQYDDWLGVDMMKEREGFAQFIPIEGPTRILDVSIGTAANFMALANVYKGQMGRFTLHGVDLSRGMLKVADRKSREKGISTSLMHANVLNLPYPKNSFNIVVHSGGINTFSDIPQALSEMLRVVKSGGFVIVTDEGLSPQVRNTERGKDILKANSLFGATPPLEHIPEKAKDLEVSHIMNGTFYQIVFRK
ncbi:MAG: class I SAM-dependent methyltransferase [Candidatus Thorarchaeota archaeon]|jgi:ubiquinone/menaquinone biosynthesis C-methylase UbiE